MTKSGQNILAIVNERLAKLKGDPEQRVRSTQVLALIEVIGEMLDLSGVADTIVEPDETEPDEN